ncbi:MAG TPA: LLM class flavin-dependent oxidoreductase, partial [Dehalococcoidia bacterium]
YMPSWELNKTVTQRAEQYGFDFVLSMIKYRGWGGTTEFWDHALESFTLMAGLAGVTERIRLHASVATLTVHPAIAARMAVTIDQISGGRFGLNIVSGWNKREYSQMGLWRGDAFYDERYDYSTEYVQILKELWANGRSSYHGRFFTLEDCLCQPRPTHEIPIVCAGQSLRGMRFTAELGDHNFVVGEIADLAAINGRVAELGRGCGRRVGTYALFTVVAASSDAEAQAIAARYRAGGDVEALRGFIGAAADDPSDGMAARLQEQAFMGIPVVIGSYASVAAYFDRVAVETGVDGVLLTFPDFVDGVTAFGEQVMPRLAATSAAVSPVSIEGAA